MSQTRKLLRDINTQSQLLARARDKFGISPIASAIPILARFSTLQQWLEERVKDRFALRMTTE